MKKIFPYVLVLLLISVTYFVYKQWYSPDSPVLYNPPLKNTAPDQLEALPVIDLYGKQSVLRMDDAPYTFFIFAPYVKENLNRNLLIYPVLEKYHKLFAEKGIRVVYLWRGDDLSDTKKEILSLINPEEQHSGYWLTRKMLKEYEKRYGIGIAGLPSFLAYNQSGELILQAEWIQIDKLALEILQVPVYDKTNFKRVIEFPVR